MTEGPDRLSVIHVDGNVAIDGDQVEAFGWTHYIRADLYQKLNAAALLAQMEVTKGSDAWERGEYIAVSKSGLEDLRRMLGFKPPIGPE